MWLFSVCSFVGHCPSLNTNIPVPNVPFLLSSLLMRLRILDIGVEVVIMYLALGAYPQGLLCGF